jgi:hypothetical protein
MNKEKTAVSARPTTARARLQVMLLAVWFVLLAHPIEGRPFYYSEEKDCETVFRAERRVAPPQKGKSLLVVYDDLTCMSQSDQHDAAVFPYSGNFIPADNIECNIPIRLKLRAPAQLDGDVDMRLFAYLELKKLQEEYKELRRRAQEVLTELSDASSGSGRLLSGQALSGEPISQEMSELERRMDILIASGPDQQGAQSLRSEDLLSSSGRASMPQGGGSGPFVAGSPAGNPANATDKLIDPRTFESSGPALSLSERPRAIAGEEAPLPWIFRAALGTLSFVMANKTEMAILGSALFLIVTILGYLNSRR